jgi:mono/diheme cytochrome c family protein
MPNAVRNGCAAAAVMLAFAAAAQESDGGAIYQQFCSGCHASASVMANMGPEAFAEAMADHPDVGSVVSGLEEPEIEALQAYLAEQRVE